MIRLFTLNITEHLTLRRQSGSQPDATNGASGKTNRISSRFFRLRRKYSPRRIPVLSNIMEVEELSPGLSGGETAARETSFV